MPTHRLRPYDRDFELTFGPEEAAADFLDLRKEPACLSKTGADWSTARGGTNPPPVAESPDPKGVLPGRRIGQKLAVLCHWQRRFHTSKKDNHSAYSMLAKSSPRDLFIIVARLKEQVKAFDELPPDEQRSILENVKRRPTLETDLFEAIERNSSLLSFTHFPATVAKYFCDTHQARKVGDCSGGLGDRLTGTSARSDPTFHHSSLSLSLCSLLRLLHRIPCI